MAKRNNVGARAWQKTIAPYVRHAARNRGFMSRVAEIMNRDHGFRLKPQQVQQWLTDDENRVEPKSGTGPFLVAACEKAIRA